MVRNFRKNFIIVFTLAILLAGGIYLYIKILPAVGGQDKENAKLIQKVGELIILPTNETPTIATVSDPEALKGQAFFADAKVGDKVLVYAQAQKAILYDPGLNKIVNVAPLTFGSN